MPTRLHRIAVPFVAALALLPVTASVAVPAAAADAELLNRVVIRVNDRIATLHDYEERKRQMEQGVIQSDATLAERREILARLPEQVYRNLLEEQLLLSRADQLGIVFTEEEVDSQMRRVRDSYGFASDQEFEAALVQTGRHLREFRRELRTNMRIQELLAREVRSEVDVDEEQARIYYRDHPEQFQRPQRMRLQELVVLADAREDTAERQELARAIRAEILSGKAIDEVVEAYGEEGLTSGAIDLGWVVAGDLASELEESVWDLGAGEVSEPVESRGGTHVIQVLEREDAGLRPFNEVSDEARGRARQQAFAEAMEAYMEELEDTSFVTLDPPAEAADFRSAGPMAMPEGPAGEPVDGTASEDADAGATDPDATDLDTGGSPEPPDPRR